jgi:hypothetical protein
MTLSDESVGMIPKTSFSGQSLDREESAEAETANNATDMTKNMHTAGKHLWFIIKYSLFGFVLFNQAE